MRGAVLLFAGCAGLPPCEGEPFVAMQEDFASYRRWPSVEVEAPDPRLGTGARTVYVTERPRRDATRYPTCTMFVKVGETTPDPATWLMVGSAKRGGDYNVDGAVGWEWFGLRPGPEGEPLIDWRGPEPPEGRGYVCAGDETGANAVGDCNTCHGFAAADDYVLTAELLP